MKNQVTLTNKIKDLFERGGECRVSILKYLQEERLLDVEEMIYGSKHK